MSNYAPYSLEYNIVDLLAVNTYDEHVKPSASIKKYKHKIGDDVYFHPNEFGHIIATTKQVESTVPVPLSSEKLGVNVSSQVFMTAVAFLGIFVLFRVIK